MFLDIYFGEQLAQSAINNSGSFLGMANNVIYYIVFAVVALYFIFVIVVFITPLFKKDKAVYFKRYEYIRQEMQKIDELYTSKKIDFEDYVYAQFNYAKEYEQIVNYLSKFEEYKSKLQNYKLAYAKQDTSSNTVATTQQKPVENTQQPMSEDQKSINFLYSLLQKQVQFYTPEEIEQSILDEGFSKEIANGVVNKFNSDGISFATKIKERPHKFASFVNTLLSSEDEEAAANMGQNMINKTSEGSIDIKSTIKNPQSNTVPSSLKDKPLTMSQLSNSKTQKVKKGFDFLNAFKLLFKGKEKTHTITEINDIFSDIEKSINNDTKLNKLK